MHLGSELVCSLSLAAPGVWLTSTLIHLVDLVRFFRFDKLILSFSICLFFGFLCFLFIERNTA